MKSCRKEPQRSRNYLLQQRTNSFNKIQNSFLICFAYANKIGAMRPLRWPRTTLRGDTVRREYKKSPSARKRKAKSSRLLSPRRGTHKHPRGSPRPLNYSRYPPPTQKNGADHCGQPHTGYLVGSTYLSSMPYRPLIIALARLWKASLPASIFCSLTIGS